MALDPFSKGIDLVKVLAMIAAAIWGITLIYGAGEDSMKAEMQPLYDDLYERYNQVHVDLSILNADAVADEAKTKSGFAGIGLKTEVDHVKREAAIKAEADAYLNRLFIASGGVLGYSKNEDSIYTSDSPRRTLSSLAKSLPDSCTGKLGLYNDLRQLDREFATEILIPYNEAQESLRDCKEYSQKIHAEMEVLRKHRDIVEAQIKESGKDEL